MDDDGLASIEEDEKEEKIQSSSIFLKRDNFIRKEDSLVISNPLVLLVCVDKYLEGGWKPSKLGGSQIDCKMLSELFRDYYGWKVLDISRSDDGYEECAKDDILTFFEIEAKTVLAKRKKLCARQRGKSKRKMFDGLVLVLVGHGGYGYFAASDDLGEKEEDVSKHKRLSMREITEVWMPKNAPELIGSPKIIIKATSKESENREIINMEIPGVCEHPNGETMYLTTSTKGENENGSYIIQSLNKILRDPQFGKEDLHSMALRARRGIELDGIGKAWVHIEHSLTKNVYFAKKE